MPPPTATPAACGTALKEWATVLEAMARGEQLLLIRKGGLIEPGTGFEILSPWFVFYPTFEHQAVNYLRPQFRGYFEEAAARRPPAGQVRFDLAGQVVRAVTTEEGSRISALAGAHIYNDAFVSQRLQWQPQQPVVLAAVRVWRLPQPVVLPVQPHFAGCKSWVALGAEVSLRGAMPVLDDAAFHDRLEALAPQLA
jgi:hypothetical protein